MTGLAKRGATRWPTRLLLAAALSLAPRVSAQAQEPAVDVPPPPDRGAAPRRKPKPKPKPAKKTEETVPELRTGTAPEPAAKAQDETSAEPVKGMAATGPSVRPAMSLSIVCDPGQAVHYEGGAGSSVWVTRAGSVTIDNPLRPLTPDVTRVLQLVVGDRTATAFGADLSALKRGASPGALEGVLGGPIRWDARLPNLPDTLNIVADSGASLAELPFRNCGQAPAARAAPVAKARGGKATTAQSAKPASPEPATPRPAVTAVAPAGPATPPRPTTLPKGALSD